MSDTPAPVTWRFRLEPAAGHDVPLPKRLSELATYAQVFGLDVQGLDVTLASVDDNPVPAEVAVRLFLKRAGRRCGLVAKWPEPDAPDVAGDGERPADATPERRGTPVR